VVPSGTACAAHTRTFSARKPGATLEKSSTALSSWTSADGASVRLGQRVTSEPRMTTPENRFAHTNHMRSVGCRRLACRFRTSAMSDHAERYAAITLVPNGLPSGSSGWSVTARAKNERWR
jgi:hypothetical protein